MTDLSTNYAGLELKNPLIAGSCGITNSVGNVSEIAKAGAGAVVLKSLFEEKILADEISDHENTPGIHTEALRYMEESAMMHGAQEYVDFIRKVKKEISVPIIASVNCSSTNRWVEFVKKIELAGADAIELNITTFTTEHQKTPEEIEAPLFNIVSEVKSIINIPVTVKISSSYTSIPRIVKELEKKGVAGVVLFNRFYKFDIDPENEEFLSEIQFTNPGDMSEALRWTGIMANRYNIDICTSSGINSAEDVAKAIYAGADACQIVSAIYRESPSIIKNIKENLSEWMDKKNISSLKSPEFKGKMSMKRSNTDAYGRFQYIKAFDLSVLDK